MLTPLYKKKSSYYYNFFFIIICLALWYSEKFLGCYHMQSQDLEWTYKKNKSEKSATGGLSFLSFPLMCTKGLRF